MSQIPKQIIVDKNSYTRENLIELLISSDKQKETVGNHSYCEVTNRYLYFYFNLKMYNHILTSILSIFPRSCTLTRTSLKSIASRTRIKANKVESTQQLVWNHAENIVSRVAWYTPRMRRSYASVATLTV